MPRDLPEDMGQTAEGNRRRKRQREPQGSSEADRYSTPAPQSEPTPAPTYDVPTQRILKLNKSSGRVLPTEIVYTLGESNLTDTDLDKAARFFGRQFDLSPEDFFTPTPVASLLPGGKVESLSQGYSLAGVGDPVTGAPVLSLRTARRLLEAQEDQMIRGWLEGQPATRKGAGISSRAIIDTLNTLTPHVGEDLSFGQALGMARAVAETRNRKAFKANLDVALRTSFGNSTLTAVTLAVQATEAGHEFRDVVDMAAYLGGATREEVAAGKALAENPQADELRVNGKVITAGVGELPVLGAIYDALKQREQSFSESADSILDEMRVEMSDDKGIAETWLDGTIGAMNILNRPMDMMFRLAADNDALFGPILAVMGEEGAWERATDAYSDMWNIFIGNESVLDNERLKELGWSDSEIMIGELYLSALIPVGAGAKAFGTAAAKAGGKLSALKTAEGLKAGLRLGGELIIDPFTGLGKLGKVTVGRKFLPGLSPEQQGAAMRSLLYDSRKALGDVDVPTYLVRAASGGDDPAAYFTKAVGRFRAEFSRDAIHPLLAQNIYRWVREGTKRGLDEDQLVRGVREFFGQAMGIPVKADGLGAELTQIMERSYLAGRKRAVAQANDPLHRVVADAQDASLRDAARAAARRSAQQLGDQLDRVAQDFASTGPIMHEVPKIKGVRTAAGATVGRAARAVGYTGESAVSRAWRGLRINELPMRQGIRFGITPDLNPAEAADGIGTIMTRSRVFSQSDIADYRTRMIAIMRPTNLAREANMTALLDELETDMLSRIGKQLNVDPDTLADWTAEVFSDGAIRRTVKRLTGGRDPEQAHAIAKGPLGTDVAITQPVLASQFRNNFGVIDPVYVRKAAKETMGYARELNAMAIKLGIGKAGKQTGQKALTITPSHAVGVLSRDVARPALGLVKLGWVARPAYVLRIVAGDELLRYAGTEGLVNRMYATRLARRLLKDRNLQSVTDIALRTGLDPEDAISLKLTKMLDDEPQASQGAIRFVRNAEGDILPADIQRAFVGRWEAVYNDGSDRFYSAWERALFQYGQDAAGRRMVANFAKGMDSEDNIDDMLRWFRSDPDGKREWARMKQNVHEYKVDETTRVAVEYLDTLLAGNHARIGGQILDPLTNGTLVPGDLANLADEVAPTVIHGPAIHPMNEGGILKKAVRGWGSLILEKPTNQLIRQPFFKANYSTVYQSLRERALLAGKEIDDTLDAAMKQEAKRFAIGRTQQVMFDFTRTGRLSELLWFVSPFFQPFTEFFLAWPKIVRQNPALIPYAYRLAKAANESGLFKTDEQTGEQVVPFSNFMGAAPLLALTTQGKLADSAGGGWELLAPVAGFNMFATNAYPYKFDGTTIPIPTPSFSPPVQWFLQWAVDKMPINDSTKQDYMAWLTEFGEIDFTRPQDFALPSWIRHAMTAAVPSWFDDQTNQNVNRFMALQQAMGLPVDEKSARGQAQAFGFMRAFISAFFPASPRVNFPTHELEEEWDELVKAHDGDTTAAREEFAGIYNPVTRQFEGGRHPGLGLITISKTMWADETNPFPMPANELADRVLNSTGGREFVKQFPMFAFFIVPKEIRESEFNLGAFFRQVTEGRREVRSPSQFLESAEVSNGWAAYFAIKTQWDAWQQAHPDQSDDDLGYELRQTEFNEQRNQIAEMFPAWNAAHELTIENGVDPNVMTAIRDVMGSREFMTKTDAGRGLAIYMAGRDELERDMDALNLTNLDTKVAERLGFVKRYDDIVAEAKQHEDFALLYDYMGLENDLRALPSIGEKQRDALSDDEETSLTEWWDTFEERKDAPYSKIIQEDERFEAYKELRNWENTAYSGEGPNPLKLWWANIQNPEEKADYMVGLGTRSPLYWSRFGWDVMGIKQTAKQQQFWTEIDEARSRAFAGNDVGADLDRVDAAIAAAAKKSKGIARQLEVMNDWSYGLRTAVFGDNPVFRTKNTRDDWQDVFDGSQTIHDYMNRYNMIGEDDYDPDLKDWYGQIKDAYANYIRKKQRDNPVFERQWEYLQDLVGTDLLIDTLMPGSNYDLGVVERTSAGVAHLGGRPLAKDEKTGVTLARRPLKSLESAQRQLGVNVLGHVEESYRTHAEQASRRASYEAGTGNLAAEPGTSDHERGIAVDITSSFLSAHPELRKWLGANGWAATVANEPWHWVYQG